jgi:hypothetical protein
MYTERKVNGEWVLAEPSTRQLSSFSGDHYYISVPYQFQIYTGRNYQLFGVLAGVRQCSDQKFERKGFPEDASPIVRGIYEQWGGDAHTPSYLTLKELKSIDWEKECVPESYWVTERQLKQFEFVLKVKENECNGTFKSKIKCSEYDDEVYNANDYDLYSIIQNPWQSRLIETYQDKYGEKYGWSDIPEPQIRIEAATPIRIALNSFYNDVISKLNMWEPQTDPEDIRIVFWFDN